MNLNRKRLIVAAVVVVLAVNAAMSVADVWTQTDRLAAERQDLADLKQLVGEMDAVSDAPRVAALAMELPDEIVNRISAAVKQAGLAADTVANQTPFEPQRIGKSDFTLRKVEIELKPATVKQIVAFCDALRDESTGSVVRDLNLFNPGKSGARETWEAQLTLTQTIFSPKSDS